MRKIILFLFSVGVINLVHAQTDDSVERYIRDVNNVLKRYTGKWEAESPEKGLRYEFVISKYADPSYIHYKVDILQMRYRILDKQGKELVSTLNLHDGDKYIIFGKEQQDHTKGYDMYYIGYEYECGQGGDMRMSFKKDKRKELLLEFTPAQEEYLTNACKEKPRQWFPQTLTLTKVQEKK